MTDEYKYGLSIRFRPFKSDFFPAFTIKKYVTNSIEERYLLFAELPKIVKNLFEITFYTIDNSEFV